VGAPVSIRHSDPADPSGRRQYPAETDWIEVRAQVGRNVWKDVCTRASVATGRPGLEPHELIGILISSFLNRPLRQVETDRVE
jgi:hypothetical protein